MKKARKVRLKPTPEQFTLLWQSAGVARWAYNWVLNRQQTNHANGGKFISNNDLRKELTQLKKQEEFQWLGDVSNNVAKQAVKDACLAYQRFFKKQAAFPRFKSRKRSKPSFYNDYLKLKVKPNRMVLLEKIGWVETNEQLPLDVVYSNPRVSFDGKYWYLSVGIETELPTVDLTETVLGIDLGIKSFAVCSDEQEFPNIHKTQRVRKLEKRLKRLQRQVSRQYQLNKQGTRFIKTKNIQKSEQKIRRIHRILRHIRQNYLHQTTTAIVKTKPYRIVVEDLNIMGMMKNKHLARSIQQQGFYEFFRQLAYKCQFYGIDLVKAPRFYPSSKICSCCGVKKDKLKLSERIYRCNHCGTEIDRDLNAAHNLANYGQYLINS